MVRFHSVYAKISRALDGMPYEELGISDEEKEQVCHRKSYYNICIFFLEGHYGLIAFEFGVVTCTRTSLAAAGFSVPNVLSQFMDNDVGCYLTNS